MIPSFLITLREVIEATLIVATILGILSKLRHTKSIKTVWTATASAAALSILLVVAASLLGLKIQELYVGHVEQIVEGVLMIVSAGFITWAVFFLHSTFVSHKVQLLQKVTHTLETQEQKGIFLLVFTAVFREGIEIVLFLSTIYFSSDPAHIFTGFALGMIGGIFVSYLFFRATLRMPVYYAFRATSIFLILFAAGLLARGIHEFVEAGFIPEIGKVIFSILPEKGTFSYDLVKSVFGISQTMDYLQLISYAGYASIMTWIVFFKRDRVQRVPVKE